MLFKRWKTILSFVCVLFSSIFFVFASTENNELKSNNYYTGYDKSSEVNIEFDSNFSGNAIGGSVVFSAKLHSNALKGSFKLWENDTRDKSLREGFQKTYTEDNTTLKWTNVELGKYPFTISFSNPNDKTGGDYTPIYCEKSFVLNLNYKFGTIDTPVGLITGSQKIINFGFFYNTTNKEEYRNHRYYFKREMLSTLNVIKKANLNLTQFRGEWSIKSSVEFSKENIVLSNQKDDSVDLTLLSYLDDGSVDKTFDLQYRLKGTDIIFDYQITVGTFTFLNSRTQTNFKDGIKFNSKRESEITIYFAATRSNWITNDIVQLGRIRSVSDRPIYWNLSLPTREPLEITITTFKSLNINASSLDFTITIVIGDSNFIFPFTIIDTAYSTS